MFGFDIETLDDVIEHVTATHKGDILGLILLSIFVGFSIVFYSFMNDGDTNRLVTKVLITTIILLLITIALDIWCKDLIEKDKAYIEKTFNESDFKYRELIDKYGNVYIGEVTYIENIIYDEINKWYSVYVDKDRNVVAIENRYGKIEINKKLQKRQVEALQIWNSYKMSVDVITK